MSQPHLQRQLHARHLWAIAVGMVISGQYFGWNYGFAKAHVLGLCIAVAIVTVFYLCFMYSYAELATCIPKAGGPTAYAHKAMGHFMGYMAGLACLIEFIFAPPAIAVAIGYYVNFLWPVIPAAVATVTSFVFCLLLNLIGTKDVAIFELVITVFALIGLALFYLAGYHFLQHHSAYKHPLFLPAHHYTLILSAIPFAIWLYLAIEGAAMSAE